MTKISNTETKSITGDEQDDRLIRTAVAEEITLLTQRLKKNSSLSQEEISARLDENEKELIEYYQKPSHLFNLRRMAEADPKFSPGYRAPDQNMYHTSHVHRVTKQVIVANKYAPKKFQDLNKENLELVQSAILHLQNVADAYNILIRTFNEEVERVRGEDTESTLDMRRVGTRSRKEVEIDVTSFSHYLAQPDMIKQLQKIPRYQNGLPEDTAAIDAIAVKLMEQGGFKADIALELVKEKTKSTVRYVTLTELSL